MPWVVEDQPRTDVSNNNGDIENDSNVNVLCKMKKDKMWRLLSFILILVIVSVIVTASVIGVDRKSNNAKY